MNETQQQTGMLTRVERKGEVAVSAMAAKAKAEVEARYVIALQRPRNINQARISILESCKRPKFAEGARYRKPVGGGRTVDGLSIRFAEEAIKAMTNIAVDAMTIWEDDEKRNVRITVTDLETNTTYGDEVTINKTVERRSLKEGQVALSERMNSTNQKVFLVAATEDELANKLAAAKSKIIRNSGLRLVPQDILDEAEETILATLEKGGKDPQAETKKICDAFASIGVKPAELERLLGHPLSSISPKELIDLRATYSAIKDGETTWAAVIAEAAPKRPTNAGPEDDGDLGPQKPKDPNAGEQAAAAIDAAAIDKPGDYIKETLCKKDGVTPQQVHVVMKAKKLAGEKTEEMEQASDPNLRKVIERWAALLPEIKAVKV